MGWGWGWGWGAAGGACAGGVCFVRCFPPEEIRRRRSAEADYPPEEVRRRGCVFALRGGRVQPHRVEARHFALPLDARHRLRHLGRRDRRALQTVGCICTKGKAAGFRAVGLNPHTAQCQNTSPPPYLFQRVICFGGSPPGGIASARS